MPPVQEDEDIPDATENGNRVIFKRMMDNIRSLTLKEN